MRNTESPFWIGNLRNSEFRCLIPVTAFMLWGAGTDYEGRRLRHWFASKDGPLFAMAGLWKDEDVPAFALLTRDPTGEIERLGCGAMPVILPGDHHAWQLWLHGDWGRAHALIMDPVERLRLIEAPQPLNHNE